MVSTWYSLAFLLLVVPASWGERNPDVCEPVTKSSGLIPPILPQNFEYRSERLYNRNKSIVWEEMHFDNMNEQAKLVYLKNGIEYHFVFDYNTEQIIQYIKLHPERYMKNDILSQACVAVPMEESKMRYIFGYRDSGFITKRARMYNSYEVLRFGGEYRYAYNSSTGLEERGFFADKFTGCVYDKFMDATVYNHYYFTNDKIVPAAGTPQYIVDGDLNGGYLSVPVGTEFTGTFNYKGRGENDTMEVLPLEGRQSINYFNGNPQFDYGTFNIPKRLYCKNYRGNRDITKFPTSFATRLEKTEVIIDIDGNRPLEYVSLEQLWYNADQRLARRDFTPQKNTESEVYNRFQNYDAVKTIYDFNTGALYTISKNTGRCYTRIIGKNDYFQTSKEDTLIKMATPEELFMMEVDSMEYKGKDFARNVMCNVWAGIYEKDGQTAYSETYTSTDGWHQDVEEVVEYGSPIRHTVIMNNVSLPLFPKNENDIEQTLTELNFFRFKHGPPPLPIFDVSSCIETLEHKFLAIVLTMRKDDEEFLTKYRWQFREAVQYFIANASGVATPLRVQRIDVTKSGGYDLITFALVAKADLKTDNIQHQNGANLDEAVENLRKFINDGKFVIQFRLPGSVQTKTVIAEKGALYPFPPDVTANYAPKAQNWYPRFKRSVRSRSAYWFADPTIQTEIEQGMTPGALAALAIAMLIIGIGVGVAIMYLYIRRYGMQGTVNQIPMK